MASTNRPERRAQREELLRAELEPLGEGERPPALLVAIAVCVLLAIGVIVGAATVHDLRRRGGSLPGGAFLAIVLLLLAVGMYRRRYWAVLGFEALLAFQIIVTSLALVVASTIIAAVICVVERRARWLAVLEARARDGPHPGRRTWTRRDASIGSVLNGRDLL